MKTYIFLSKAPMIGLCLFMFTLELLAQKQGWNLPGRTGQYLSFKDTVPVLIQKKFRTPFISEIFADSAGIPLFTIGSEYGVSWLYVEQTIPPNFFEFNNSNQQYNRVVQINDTLYRGIMQNNRNKFFTLNITLKDKLLRSVTLDTLKLDINSTFSCPVLHASGNKWWYLMNEFETNMFHKGILSNENNFLLLEDQAIGLPLEDSTFYNNVPFDSSYYLDSLEWKDAILLMRNLNVREVCAKVSPKGDRVAFLRRQTGRIVMYDFDRCSGQLSNFSLVQEQYPATLMLHLINNNKQKNHIFFSGIEFSPDASKLYVNNNDSIFQYDISSPPSYPRKTIFSDLNNITRPKGDTIHWIGLLNLAPDGKIYVYHDATKGLQPLPSDTNSMYYGVIHEPNRLGLSCKYIHSSFLLGEIEEKVKNPMGGSFPPNYALGRLSLSEVAATHRYHDTLFVCPTDSIRLGTFSRPNIQYRWSPKDYLDSDTVATPIFIGEKAGIYPYVLTVRGLAGSCWEGETVSDTVWIVVRERKDTLCKHVSIIPKAETKPALSIYPNPSQDGYTLFLESDISRALIVEIHDIMGKKILEQTITLKANEPMEHYLDTQHWFSGIYLCTIRQDGHILNSQKLLLIK